MKSTPEACPSTRNSQPVHAFADQAAADLERAGTERMASLGILAAGLEHEALSGEISVASQPGRGTSFQVSLPHAPEDSGARHAVLEPAPESESAPSRILIIDDEPLLGQTLHYAFKGRHEVVICTSGRDALTRLEADFRFDLVLCDLMMPDVSGAAVYESVKHSHPELVPRFVFMTGGAFTDRARAFLSQHSGAQLEKPFNIAEIEKILRQLSAARAAVTG